MLGRRINNFEIVRLIGEGGMGAVYEAEHPLIRRKVAVKVLRREFAFDEDLVRRFLNEARATNEIRHPNIVEIIDVGALADGVPYLILELLEGESLGTRLARLGSFDVEAAIDTACQASSALEAAHAHGIIHRDLKPDNIFLCPDQRAPGRELVKVLDFGIAKLRGGLSSSPVDTRAGAILGTPPYMSPEQCRGIPEDVDHRTDIYGLGIILYEMLCGEPPFVAAGVGDMMMMHMSTPPEPPSQRRADVPEHVERAVLTALAKRREDRFSSMGELRAALGGSREPSLILGLRSPVPPHPGDAALEGAPTALFEPRRAAEDVTPVASNPSLRAGSVPAATSLNHAKDSERGQISEAPPAAKSRSTLWLAAGVALVGVMFLLVSMTSKRPLSNEVLASRSSTIATSASGTNAAGLSIPGAGARPTAAAASPPETAGMPASAAGGALLAAPERLRSARPPRKEPTSAGEASVVSATSARPSTEIARSTSALTSSPMPVNPSGSPAPSAAAQVGHLTLDSAPWSNVFLGTKLLGTTPLLRLSLPAGRHVLTLKNPELGVSTSYVVEIKPGAAISRFVGWEKP